MTPEMVQLLYLAGAAALGWFLRHRGLGAPATPAAPAIKTASPADLAAVVGKLGPNWQPNFGLAGQHPLLDALSTWMLDQLASAIKSAPVTLPPK